MLHSHMYRNVSHTDRPQLNAKYTIDKLTKYFVSNEMEREVLRLKRSNENIVSAN